MPLGIDATIRYSTNNWQRPIRQSELDKHEPYNTRLNRGLPPTPIGNPGLASHQGRRQARPARTTCSTCASRGKSGEHAFSSTDAQFQRDVAKYQASRGGRMIRLGVCGWPVRPSHARRRCTTRRSPTSACDDWRYQHLPLPPHLFAETVRALPRAGFRGVNVTIPHKEQALALADDATETAQGDRRREHAHVRRRRHDPRRQHRRARLPHRAQHAPPTTRPRSCSAPAAPPARSSTRSSRRASASCALWNRTPGASASARRRVRRDRRAPSRPTSSSTARRSASTTRTRRSRRCPSGPMTWVPDARWWTWSTGTAAHFC